MEKYITLTIPMTDIDGKNIYWWASDHMPRVIEKLEKDNVNYDFVQVVTSAGNGGHREFVIMKLKPNLHLSPKIIEGTRVLVIKGDRGYVGCEATVKDIESDGKCRIVFGGEYMHDNVNNIETDVNNRNTTKKDMIIIP